MKHVLLVLFFAAAMCGCGHDAFAQGRLSWPIACVPGLNCLETRDGGIGYPDIAVNEETSHCRTPAYKGHTGTDIYVPSVESSIPVLASADGQVMWVNDGMFDHCPDANEADCAPRITPICSASAGSWSPDADLSCSGRSCDCLWGFNAGNYVLIRHDSIKGIAFTLYAHLQKGSITVRRGQDVYQGSQIAAVGSSGNAARPHLHFGVWRTMVGNLELANPWGNSCNSDSHNALWYSDPPFLANIPALANKPHAAPASMTKVDNNLTGDRHDH